MSKHLRLWLAFFLTPVFSFSGIASGQVRLESQSFKLGLRSEYLSLGLQPGEGKVSPQLATYLVNLSLHYKLQAGFEATLLLGYASSNYTGLFFRRLPFSIAFEGRGVSGVLAGVEASKGLFSFGSLSVDVFGHFQACIGLTKKYEIPNLAVAGTVKANPSWMRAMAGPLFMLTSQEKFTPYFSPCFHYLWGTFSMSQTVDSLKGDEKKQIKSNGFWGFLLGGRTDVGKSLELRAEVGLYPRKAGSDYSLLIQALFAF